MRSRTVMVRGGRRNMPDGIRSHRCVWTKWRRSSRRLGASRMRFFKSVHGFWRRRRVGGSATRCALIATALYTHGCHTGQRKRVVDRQYGLRLTIHMHRLQSQPRSMLLVSRLYEACCEYQQEMQQNMHKHLHRRVALTSTVSHDDQIAIRLPDLPPTTLSTCCRLAPSR